MLPKSPGFMLELFFIERGLLRTITGSLRAPVITNKIKNKKSATYSSLICSSVTSYT